MFIHGICLYEHFEGKSEEKTRETGCTGRLLIPTR